MSNINKNEEFVDISTENNEQDDVSYDFIELTGNFEDELDEVNDENDDSDNSSEESSNDNTSSKNDTDLKNIQDEADYIRFVKSINFDSLEDFDNLSIANSFLDDDDDEEYNPEDNNNYDLDHDHDYELDVDLQYVEKKEVQDLVDGCWRTIIDDSNNTPKRSATVDNISIDLPVLQDNNNNNDNNPGIHAVNDLDIPKGRVKDVILNQSPIKSIHNSPSKSQPYVANTSTSSTAVTNVVNKIFDNPSSEILIYGCFPIDSIRKVVARQMSIAIQLLLQLLLLCDDKSECFTKCFHYLMELSNYREKAIKKHTLLTMNLENVRKYQSSKPNCYQRGSTVREGITSKETIITTEKSSPEQESRLTRSVISNKINNHISTRSASVIDIPILNKMSLLFQLIDSCRAKFKAISETSSNSTLALYAQMTQQSSLYNTSVSSSSNQLKLNQFILLRECIINIFNSLGMRYWTCALPTRKYPLTESEWSKYDSSSLLGRCYFTASEDELLLRGLISYASELSFIQQMKKLSLSYGISASSVPSMPNSMNSSSSTVLGVNGESINVDKSKTSTQSNILSKSLSTVIPAAILASRVSASLAIFNKNQNNSLNSFNSFKSKVGNDVEASNLQRQSNSNLKNETETKEDDDEYPWSEIRLTLLPSKEKQSLQFRFSQMTSMTPPKSEQSMNSTIDSTMKLKIPLVSYLLSSLCSLNQSIINPNEYLCNESLTTSSEYKNIDIEEDNRFQQYLKLKRKFTAMSDNKFPERWLLFDDIQVFRGYAVFGQNWHLIRIFYLPNRHVKEIKIRLATSI